MEQLAQREGGVGLYRLPPGMILCMSADSVARLINRSRTTVWRYVQAGQLKGFNVAGNIVIPLADVASLMGLTQSQIHDIALTHKFPLWQIFPKGG